MKEKTITTKYNMLSGEIRNKFLKFFEERGHKIIASSSLVPENDTSVLFTTAGMQQFKKYYSNEELAEKDFGTKNVVTVQKCIRTSDIDEVGDNTHLTFFEMLGNFSFGGYGRDEAIKYAYEFITKEMGLEISYVTIYKGSENVPKDEESEKIWREIGIENIKEEGDDVFWGPTGDSGPCGRTTEIYCKNATGEDVEVWNIVFNEYFCNGSRGQLDKGEIKLEKLPVLGIDTGMGFERLVTVIQNKNSFYGTDLFDEVMSKVNQSDNNNEKSKKIILDHIKASIFLICDGVVPSNTEGGYVLRRLIRRAIVHINSFNIQISLPWLIETITEKYSEIYPDLIQNKTNIEKVLNDEDEKFAKTITLGLKEFEKGVDPFILFTTYGFPIELTEEMAKEKGQKIDLEDFHKKLKEHQKLSQTASAGMFKGGLGGHGEMETQYHTATHLLNGALRMVLGNHVSQKGSNITGERLRFDFSNSQKLTDEEIKRVEDLVNEKIKEALPVTFKEMSLEDAKKTGAQGVFDSKYGDNVTVYQIGENGDIFSLEICGGPHVKNTEELAANPSGTLKHFKIKKEEAVGEGIRRIKAVLE